MTPEGAGGPGPHLKRVEECLLVAVRPDRGASPEAVLAAGWCDRPAAVPRPTGHGAAPTTPRRPPSRVHNQTTEPRSTGLSKRLEAPSTDATGRSDLAPRGTSRRPTRSMIRHGLRLGSVV